MFRDDWVMGYTRSQTAPQWTCTNLQKMDTIYFNGRKDWLDSYDHPFWQWGWVHPRIRSGVRHPMWYVLLDLIKVPTCKSHTCQWFPPKVLHKVVVSDTKRDDDWFTNKVPQAPKSKVLFFPLSPTKKKLIPYRYERTNVCCCFFKIMSTRRCCFFVLVDLQFNYWLILCLFIHNFNYMDYNMMHLQTVN